MKYCPYDWARDKKSVVKALDDWIIFNMWKDVDFSDKHFLEAGGFRFKVTKTGRRYLETIPIRIYID